MKSCTFTIILLPLVIINFIEGIQLSQMHNNETKQYREKRQLLGFNLIDPYYAFNPDYMGGNMPNIQLYQNNVYDGQAKSCTCYCDEVTYGPPIICDGPYTCIAYCLKMYPGQCRLINTYGCCGSFCKYFQSQSLQTRYCKCNCADQQYFNPTSKCQSSQSCLTLCRSNYPQACMAATTRACCGTDCQTYSQAITDLCACQCQGNTYYPSPKCVNSEGCLSLCLTTYDTCQIGETQGCCGASCSSYIPTCSCNCGSNFTTLTSVPCRKSRNCVETCISSYSACTQENTQACCGADCTNSFLTCSCLCGSREYIPLNIRCDSPQQCALLCIQYVSQCSITNTQGCCGVSCYPYVPTCQCRCRSGIYYTTSTCNSAEQCTNECIIQFGYTCTPTSTVGCCNGTFCTSRNRFLGVNEAFKFRLSHSVIVPYISFYVLF